jgi:hypothetical protein
MVATGSKVSVNTIIGIPFMKVTGMILDLVDKVVECKYLDCLPFPVDFRRTSNPAPSVMDNQNGTPAHHAKSPSQWIQEIKNLERFYDAKGQGNSSMMIQNPAVCFSRSAVRVAARNLNDTCMASHPDKDIATWWVPPPSSMIEDIDNYTASVLGGDRSL